MTTPTDTQRRLLPPLLPAGALLAVAVVSYWPALHGGFVWDDESAVVNNPLLVHTRGLAEIWTTTGRIPDETHWWPITYTVLWVGRQLSGLQPFGFHLVNVLLHAGVSWQLWRFMRKLALPGAWLAAVAFAVHPVHVEAAAWVIGVKDLLATGFCLLAAERFLAFDQRATWRDLTAVGCCAVAAMLSKSIAVTLPIGLALLVWYRDGRIAKRLYAALVSLAALTVGLGVFDAALSKHTSTVPTVAPPMIERLLHAGCAFWFYLGKLVWPRELSLIYPAWHVASGDLVAWLALVMIALVTGALWRFRGQLGRGPFVCWAFYGVALSPVLGVIHFPLLEMSPAADRYQYFASLAPLMGAAACLARAAPRLPRSWQVALATGVAAVLITLGTLTGRQSAIFRSQTTVFRHAASVAPESWVVWSNLGSGLKADGKNEEALVAFRRATELNPKDRASWANAGLLLMNMDRPAEAETAFKRALDLDPNFPPALTNLGLLLLRQNRVAEAKHVWERRLALQPNDVRAMTNLAYACGATGDIKGQVALYRRALKIDPDSHDVLNNLALTLIRTGIEPEAGEEALHAAERAVACSPKSHLPRYLNTLAMTESAIGRQTEGRATAERALQLAREIGATAAEAQSRELLRAFAQIQANASAP